MRIISPAAGPPTSDSLRNENSSASVYSQTNAGSPLVATVKGPILATMISTMPTVTLDTDLVSDHMAARLCISFLGHVMFLKNQVPFPIVQLARMPATDDTTRAAKKRHELLNSFDTLASHLYTTFVALSTALALRGSPENVGSDTHATLDIIANQRYGSDRAFFAVALGPTLGAAKTRVIVGINALETKVWGLRPDKPLGALDPHEESECDNDEDEDAVHNSSDTDESEGEEDGSTEEDEVSEPDDDEPDADASDGSPPPSRSPSPSSLSGSDDSPPPGDLRVEDPEALRAAERLLSRTLAAACAEDDGRGLASEMAPTQTHVLLRAPRRFAHPAWTPRQNLCASWDSYLTEFLQESGEAPIFDEASSKKRAKANKVQGVWVMSRESVNVHKGMDKELAEEDEMIWWSWDGKLAGFADW